MALDALTDLQPSADQRAQRTRRRARCWEWGPLALPSFVAAVVAFFWVPSGQFLAAGDVTPFFRDGIAHELTSYWNHRANGAGGTSPVIARSVEVAVIRLVGLVGGPPTLAQHLFFAALMAFAAFGVAYFARAFVRHPVAVATAGLLGVFNPFVLVRLPNPVPLVWLGLVAFLAGILIRVARGAPRSTIAFAFATLPASYLSVNPPLLVTAAVAVLIITAVCSTLVGPGGTRRAARFLARSLPWGVALNLWWLVPIVLSTVARQGIAVAAQTRVEDWAWSHDRNTVANVVTLTADWGWKYPEYLAFARGLDAFPWSWFRWILPLLALAAPFVTTGRRRVAAGTLIGVGLVGAFVGKGLHPPFESWNLWLYHHVPGMWLLREPMSKAGGLLLLAEVVLAAITVAALLNRFAHLPRARSTVGAAVLGGAVCLALAFPHPLWTGGFGSDGRHGLPSDQVAVPAAWPDLASSINESPVRGKVLVLPLDPYYQVTTTWGFHGADELAKDLIRRPVLQLLPDGYFSPAGDVPTMLHATEDALSAGDTERAETLLEMLGVSHVIVRHDLAPSRVIRQAADPDRLGAALADMPATRAPRAFGVADVYTIKGGAQLVWMPDTVTGLVRRNAQRRVDALSDLGPTVAAVAPTAAPLDALSWEAASSSRSRVQFALRTTGVYQLGLAETAPTRWSARVVTAPDDSRLELADSVDVTLDGTTVPGAPSIVIPIDADWVDAVEINGTPTLLNDGETIVDIAPQSSVRALTASAFTPAGTRFTPAGACGPWPAEAARPSITPIRHGVELRSPVGVACTTIPSPAISNEGAYRVRFQLQSTDGNTARFACVWQEGPESCAAMEQPAASRSWTTFDTVVRTDAGTTGLVLFLYAEATTDQRAAVRYRDVSVTPLRTVGLATVDPSTRPEVSRSLARGDHILEVSRASASHELSLDSPLGDCNRSDKRPVEETGLSAHRIRGGVRLSARAHAACVTATIPDAVADQSYSLDLDVRTVSGARARLCVWQVGPNRCAEVDALPANDSWTRYHTTVRLEPTTTAARVYLYADGRDDPTTITEYRNLTLRSVQPDIVELRPQDPTPVAPRISWRQRGTDQFEARVHGAARGRLLIVDESFGPGWQLDGAQRSSHIVANGYANAWLLDTTKPGTFTAHFGPSRYTDLAIAGSILAALVALIVAWLLRRRSRYATTPPTFVDLGENDGPRSETRTWL